jgi:hypothetical protein
MLDCIFTLDYEIYGDGSGSLEDLVLRPANELKAIFDRYNAKFVIFVEAAEFEILESVGFNLHANSIASQIRDFRRKGYEIGLHIHPQWYNGYQAAGAWILDGNEYNLCSLPIDRIRQILQRSLDYLRKKLDEPDFTPLAFRAGNWLLQPTLGIAKVLIENGIRVDSSVYRGGLQKRFGLDYRRTWKHGYFWRFREDVTMPDPSGELLELPTYTTMVPSWRLLNSKRIYLQQRHTRQAPKQNAITRRLRDFLRLRQPMKLDFCRLSFREIKRMLDRELQMDRETPGVYRPIVIIGHTKDLIDLKSVEDFLTYLMENHVTIADFGRVVDRCL